MANQKSKTVVKAIVWILLVALLAGGIGLIFKLTNGFKEDIKTVALVCDGAEIKTLESDMTFKYNKEYTFELRSLSSSSIDYSVKVSKGQEDITEQFDIVKGKDSFVFSVPSSLDLATECVLAITAQNLTYRIRFGMATAASAEITEIELSEEQIVFGS